MCQKFSGMSNAVVLGGLGRLHKQSGVGPVNMKAWALLFFVGDLSLESSSKNF